SVPAASAARCSSAPRRDARQGREPAPSALRDRIAWPARLAAGGSQTVSEVRTAMRWTAEDRGDSSSGRRSLIDGGGGQSAVLSTNTAVGSGWSWRLPTSLANACGVV